MSKQDPLIVGTIDSYGENIALLEEFLELNPDDLKIGSLKNYKSIGNLFLNWLRDHGNYHFYELDELTLMKYKKFISKNTGLSLRTKLNRFNITKRLIKWVIRLIPRKIRNTMNIMDLYDFKMCLDDKTKFNEDLNHAPGREQIYMSYEEIQIFMRELKIMNPQKYLMFRILIETGCRKFGVLSLSLDCNGKPIEYYLYRREVYISKGKTGKHIYYCSEELRDLLLDYVKERRTHHKDINEVFLSRRNNGYTNSTLNEFLSKTIVRINRKYGETVLNPRITVHTFRRTLNNLREKEKNCPSKWLSVLLCQKFGNVNFNHYIDKSKGFLEQYDLYNPYKELIKLNKI